MVEKNKARFDKKVRAAELFEGDGVLVRNVNNCGKHKVADRWEQRVHVVVKWIGNSPVYVGKPETGEGPHRTLHRDLLLLCGFLSAKETQEVGSHTDVPRKMRLRDKTTKGTQGDADDQEDELSSDEDDLCPSTQVPDIITRGPFIQRGEYSTEPQPVPRVLNPDIPAFVPQSSTHVPAKPSYELQSEVHFANSERSGALTHSTPHCRAPDHVVIDIPEPNVTHT